MNITLKAISEKEFHQYGFVVETGDHDFKAFSKGDVSIVSWKKSDGKERVCFMHSGSDEFISEYDANFENGIHG